MGGAWWATVFGVAQSRTQLKQLSSSSSIEIGVLLFYRTIVSTVFLQKVRVNIFNLVGFIVTVETPQLQSSPRHCVNE